MLSTITPSQRSPFITGRTASESYSSATPSSSNSALSSMANMSGEKRVT